MRRRTRTLLASVLTAAAAAVGVAANSGHLPTMESFTGNTTVAVSAADAPMAELLSRIEVVPSVRPHPGYQRGCGTDKSTGQKQSCVFGPAWNDPQDSSGCDTRNRVLAVQLSDVTFKAGTRNCKVTAGWRLDPYTGQRIDRKDTEIDHIVPLAAAWNAGAWQWPQQQRVRFANDLDNLLAVSARENSSKSSRTISQWLPAIGQCEYVKRYLSVIAKYQLAISAADERTAVSTCADRS